MHKSIYSNCKSSSVETASWYQFWSGFVHSAISAALSFWRFPFPLWRFSTLWDLRVGDDLGLAIEICLQSREDTMDFYWWRPANSYWSNRDASVLQKSWDCPPEKNDTIRSSRKCPQNNMQSPIGHCDKQNVKLSHRSPLLTSCFLPIINIGFL